MSIEAFCHKNSLLFFLALLQLFEVSVQFDNLSYARAVVDWAASASKFTGENIFVDLVEKNNHECQLGCYALAKKNCRKKIDVTLCFFIIT